MKTQLITRSSGELSIRKLLILSCLTGTIITTLPLKMISQPSSTIPISQCVAADWSALKSEIQTRYDAVENSLNEIVTQVGTDGFAEANITSTNQIKAIDSLLTCLNNPLVETQSKQPVIDSLYDLKNSVLVPAQSGLTEPRVKELKEYFQIDATSGKIGDEFVAKFSETIENFKINVRSKINQLQKTSSSPSPVPPTPSSSPVSSDKQPLNGKSLPILAILLMLGGLGAIVLIFLINSNRSRTSHHHSRRNSILHRLQTEVHLPLLSSKWNQEDLPKENMMDSSSEIYELRQKLDQLEPNFKKEIEAIKKEIQILNSVILELNLKIKIYPDSSIPYLNTVAVNPIVSPTYDTFSQTPSNSVSQLVEIYNTNSSSLQGIGVSETETSFNQRRTSSHSPVILHKVSNSSFFIIEDYYLIPRPGSKVTTHKLNTIDALFDCDGFRSGAEFQLIEPAIVSPLGGNQWQVTQKGKLRFL